MSKKKQSKKQINKGTSKFNFPSYFTDHGLLYGKLFLVSILLYVFTIGHDFTQDDAIVLEANSFTKQGVKGVEGLLKYDTFYGFFNQGGKDNLVAGGRYRPLTPVMFAFGYELFGENPMPYHIMNILWYALTVLLLFIVIKKIFEGNKNIGYVYFVAFVTAMLFAIHPVHTEVVANIKGRDEIMTLFLSLAAAYYVFKGYDTNNKINWLFSGILFFLAMMAKEMAVVFIPIIAVGLFIFRDEKMDFAKKMTNIILHLVPVVIGFVVFMFIRNIVLGSAADTQAVSMELMNNPFLKYVTQSDGSLVLTHYTSSEKFATIFYGLGKYLQLSFIPYQLTHDYYPVAISLKTFSDPMVMLSVLIHLALVVYAIWGVLKNKHLAFGVAVYLVSIFLISNIPVVIGVNIAERFLFMPSVGICFAVAILLYQLSQYFNKGKIITEYAQFKPAFMILAVLFLAGSYKTITRSFDWKDNYTLFERDWSKSRGSAKVLNSRGGSLIDKALEEEFANQPTVKEQMFREAAERLTEAIQIHPLFKGAYLLRGNAYLYLAEYDKAITDYTEALRLDPNFVDAQNNLKQAQELGGTASLEKKGIEAGSTGNFNAALGYFQQLVNQYPNEPKYRFFLGSTFANLGDHQSAIRELKKSEELNKDPNNLNRIYSSLVISYQAIGDTANATIYQAKIQQ